MSININASEWAREFVANTKILESLCLTLIERASMETSVANLIRKAYKQGVDDAITGAAE